MDVPNLFSELDDYIANKIQNNKFKFNAQLFDIVNQRFDQILDMVGTIAKKTVQDYLIKIEQQLKTKTLRYQTRSFEAAFE